MEPGSPNSSFNQTPSFPSPSPLNRVSSTASAFASGGSAVSSPVHIPRPLASHDGATATPPETPTSPAHMIPTQLSSYPAVHTTGSQGSLGSPLTNAVPLASQLAPAHDGSLPTTKPQQQSSPSNPPSSPPVGASSGAEVFLTMGLKQLLEACGTNARLTKVRDASQKLLDDLSKDKEGRTLIAAELVEPFKRACDTEDARLALIGLDALQKLLAYGHLRAPEDDDTSPQAQKMTALILSVVKTICANVCIPDERVHLKIVTCISSAVNMTEVHGEALVTALSTVHEIQVSSKESVNQTAAHTTLTQTINHVFTRLETHHVHRDATDLFNFLCRQAMTEVNDQMLPESVPMRRCQSALDFIRKILHGSGTEFRTSRDFQHSIRQSLCDCLLQNCMNTVPSIFKVSLDIFTALIFHFKRYLKLEIGVLLQNVFLKILESPNTPYNQKTAVIQALQKVSATPQVILDIFINYDCCVKSSNIFERIVLSMSRMVQAELGEWIDPTEESTIKRLALQTLVTILRSMAKWMDKYTQEDDASAASGKAGIGEKMQLKRSIEKGIAEFNKKPKKGLEYLFEHNICQNTPESIGRFLRRHGVDKAILADFLGEEGAHAAELRRAYISTMDFRNFLIDNGLRKFLSIFKLPVEGQKIERILETWSEVYLDQNQKSDGDVGCPFGNADAVHVLAVGVVMLNTDLHNPQVKQKMAKDGFVRQLRGVNNGQNFPQDFIEGIYDRIAEQQFKAESLDAAALLALQQRGTAPAGFARLLANPETQRKLDYSIESQQIKATARDLMQSAAEDDDNEYHDAVDLSAVVPMFNVLWAAMLAAFSVQLEQATDTDSTVIKSCLEGFQLGIHISAYFELAMEREAFVQSLSKMTYITSLKHIGWKNVESIKILVETAHKEGNTLRNSWKEVIRTVSQLEHLHIIGRAAHAGRASVEGSPQYAQYEEVSAARANAICREIDEATISKMFSNTSDMSQEGLVDFVESLCAVCREEVLEKVPRLFCLLKLNEVATDNLGPRIAWIWSSISSLFVEIGTKAPPSIAKVAIDSLRQMVSKCLSLQVLLDHQLQGEFLDPFYRILVNKNTTADTKDLILRCFQQVISKSQVIQSGWSTVFRTLTCAAASRSDDIIQLGYEILTHVLNESFRDIQDYLVQAVHALYGFAASTSRNVSMCALDEQLPKLIGLVPLGLLVEDQEVALWLEVLHDLVALSRDPRAEIRVRSVQLLKEVVQDKPSRLPKKGWEILLDLLTIPQVEPFTPETGATGKRSMSRDEWLQTTAEGSAEIVVNAFCSNVSQPTIQELLPEVVTFFCNFAKEDIEACIRIGLRSLRRLVEGVSSAFTEVQWDAVSNAVCDLINQNQIPQRVTSGTNLELLNCDAYRQTEVLELLQPLLLNHHRELGMGRVHAILSALFNFHTAMLEPVFVQWWHQAASEGPDGENFVRTILEPQSRSLGQYFSLANRLPEYNTLHQEEIKERSKQIVDAFTEAQDKYREQQTKKREGTAQPNAEAPYICAVITYTDAVAGIVRRQSESE